MHRCDICGRPAEIDVAGNINGRETSLHLCGRCARKHGLAPDALDPVSLAAFLEDVMEAERDEAEDEAEDVLPLMCPNCSLTRDEVEHHGRLGCAQCYDTFAPLLRDDNNDDDGTALSPTDDADEDGADDELAARLQERLQQAVSQEAYEEAARLRDRLEELDAAGRGSGPGNGGGADAHS